MTAPGASVRKGNFTLMDRIDISEMARKTSFLTADLDVGIDMDAFLERFSALVQEGLTVVSAGDNPICRYVMGRIAANFDGTEAIWHPVPWITPEEVDDMVLAFGSEFRKEYGNGFTKAYLRLAACLARMEDSSDIFVRYVRGETAGYPHEGRGGQDTEDELSSGRENQRTECDSGER